MAIGGLNITETDVVAGQKVFASTELNRIAEIETWANDQVVDKAMDLDTAQTATAKKTFGAGADMGSQIISNVKDPIAEQDAATKKSTEALVTSLGSWVSNPTGFATSITALTDGFVCAYVNSGSSQNLNGYTPVATRRMQFKVTGEEVGSIHGSISFPVKSGDTWKVTGSSQVYWIPLS
jgi:hypothetical protein